MSREIPADAEQEAREDEGSPVELLGIILRKFPETRAFVRKYAKDFLGGVLFYDRIEHLMKCNVCGSIEADGEIEETPRAERKFWHSIWTDDGSMWHCRRCLSARWFYTDETEPF